MLVCNREKEPPGHKVCFPLWFGALVEVLRVLKTISVEPTYYNRNGEHLLLVCATLGASQDLLWDFV